MSIHLILYRNINIYLTILDYLNTSNVVLIVYNTYIDEAIIFVIVVNIPLFLQDMYTRDRFVN